MSNLQPLKWVQSNGMGVTTHTAESPLHSYIIRYDELERAYLIDYFERMTGEHGSEFFKSVDEAKNWAQSTHYRDKMQPYVKPSPTWISVDDRLPNELKAVLIIYEANLNFKPRKFMAIALREGGDWLGIDDIFGGYVFDDEYNADKFNDDLHGFNITHWMPIPEFKQGE